MLRVSDRPSGIPPGAHPHHPYTLVPIVSSTPLPLGLVVNGIAHLAPNTQGFSSDYDGPLRHDAGAPEVIPMTRLQVAMSRELFSWPLYTIVIALGQVCATVLPWCCLADKVVDAKRH